MNYALCSNYDGRKWRVIKLLEWRERGAAWGSQFLWGGRQDTTSGWTLMIVSVLKSLSHMVPFLSNRSILCWLLHVQVTRVDCMKHLSVLSFSAKTNPSQRPGKNKKNPWTEETSSESRKETVDTEPELQNNGRVCSGWKLLKGGCYGLKWCLCRVLTGGHFQIQTDGPGTHSQFVQVWLGPAGVAAWGGGRRSGRPHRVCV